MKYPKCKTCGKEHALDGCPEFQPTAGRKPVERRGILAIDSFEDIKPEPQRPSATKLSLPKTKMGRPRTGYIKAEYNRQYSADKRAALKLGISVPEYRALHTPYPVDENTTTK